MSASPIRAAMGVGAFAAALASCIMPVTGADDAAPSPIRFGITAGVIDGQSASDARAASQLWATGIAEAMGGLYRGAEATVYGDVGEAVRAVSAREADVVAISSLEFLAAEKQLKCRPAMVYEVNGEVTQEFVLVARVGTSPLSVEGGKSLVVYSPTRQGSLSDHWADVHLRESGVRNGLKSLAEVRYVDRRGHAAMAVFFKQADFAIESRSALRTAIELNPQLGRELTILGQSAPLLPGLVCMSHLMPQWLQQKYIEGAIRLHEQPRYRQAFVVMRVTRIAVYQPSFLDNVRALLAKQRALTAKR